jgi:hypothetical protein
MLILLAQRQKIRQLAEALEVHTRALGTMPIHRPEFRNEAGFRMPVQLLTSTVRFF